MPLSKSKNRQRMRLVRLHKLLEVKSVQPKTPYPVRPDIDADGNVIPEFT